MTKFVFTNGLTLISNRLWEYTSIAGACLSFLVLVVIAVCRIHPRSSEHLDRVSFRLLTIALFTSMFFGISNAVGGSWTGPTWACGFSIWILQFTLQYSSFLIFCIALNLQLVVCHHVRVHKLEKWYIFGSLILALAITVPAYATSQYGWDPLVLDCWYKNPNMGERIAWQVGSQLLWQLLATLGEIITSCTVIVFMWKNRAATKSGSRKTTGTDSSAAHPRNVSYANAYRGVIIRIGLYPLASMVLNVTSVACVLRATVFNGVHDWTGYRTLLLSDFIYGGRPVVYAILAATDPSLQKAIRALLGRPDQSSSGTRSRSLSGATVADEIASGVRVELTKTRYVDPVEYTYPPDKWAHTHRDQDVFDLPAHTDSTEALPDKRTLAFGGSDSEHYSNSRPERSGADPETGVKQHMEAIRERRKREAEEAMAGRDIFKKSI